MGPRRKTEKTAAEQNPVTDDAGNLPEQTDPEAPATTTPTDPETVEALAAATAADAAEHAPEQPTAPLDAAAGSDGGPKIEGPSEPEQVTVGDPKVERHSKGCPAERLESYPARQPDGTTVKVSHCLDCGATEIADIE